MVRVTGARFGFNMISAVSPKGQLRFMIVGGKVEFVGGSLPVPLRPGLGIELDRERVQRYHEAYLRLGGYPYDRDPARPGWAPVVPNPVWADPFDDRAPVIPV